MKLAAMNLGGRIQTIIDERGLGQAYVLERVPGLSQQALSNLITRDSMTSEFALRIADALNVSARWLLDGVGQPERTSADEPVLAQIQKPASLSRADFLAYCASLSEPERQVALRLMAAGGLVPGLVVEVKGKWAPKQPERERGRRQRDPSAATPKQDKARRPPKTNTRRTKVDQ